MAFSTKNPIKQGNCKFLLLTNLAVIVVILAAILIFVVALLPRSLQPFSFSRQPTTTVVVPESPSIAAPCKKGHESEDLSGLPCNLFDGRWVVDDDNGEGPRYYQPGSCPFIDKSFDCVRNGRRDLNYTKLRWQPNGCSLPRLEGRRMMEMLRGKRVAFVGDSLNRNMWESLVCILRSSLRYKHRVFEVSGRAEFKTEGSYAFRFQDYNCSIEFYRSPFLVQEEKTVDSEMNGKDILKLDSIDKSSVHYRDADVLIFNSAHWWTHRKTSQGRDYYKEGDHLHKQLSSIEAYGKALRTWARWIDSNVPATTLVFFRGYSTSHFRGGQWNSGGSCAGETAPITDDRHLQKYPKMMSVLESVMKEMNTDVLYLNITRLTGYRKDAHPSVFREKEALQKPGLQLQDCSHWCLPGVPDTWNELLYATLLEESVYEERSNKLRLRA